MVCQGNRPNNGKTLSSIAGRQAKATQQLKDEVHWFLDYCATHPDAIIRYHASDMRLALHSDGSYLSEPNSKSRAAGHYYLINKGTKDLNNGAILTLTKIIKHVMGSAGETEVAGSGSEMLMHVKPGDRTLRGLNAKKAWYGGPALKHYRAFHGVVHSTKGERISDSVTFQDHAIAVPSLTPADRILGATRDLKRAPMQQPKTAP